jgi:8-oxo-dGTP pyrophosphatase MutT (NUDIX family)
MPITFTQLRQALSLSDFDPQAHHQKMSPVPRGNMSNQSPRQAGVLVLVYPQVDELHILLTRRTDKLTKHSGQISFPGGRFDDTDKDYIATALRETCEELGLCSDDMQIIGRLGEVYIPPSNFNVHPTVATLPYIPTTNPNSDEVAEVFSVGVDELISGMLDREEDRILQGYTVRVPYYQVREHKVWGATALMLSELSARLKQVTG